MSISAKLKSLLLNAGLSESGILVYIELLKNPVQTKWELTTRTGLDKNAVYRAFPVLEKYKMVQKTKDGYKAKSLKILVSELHASGRKFRKLADKMKLIAPFLRAPQESIEEFETLYTVDQISDAYLFMSQTPYDVNLDIGDFENFIPILGGLDIAHKFRNNRVKHASHHAICTTFGPNTGYFCTKEAEKKFKNKVDFVKTNEKGRFVIFSAESDYVLFNYFEDEENQCSVLVKSSPIAEMQRMQFRVLSQQFEKC